MFQQNKQNYLFIIKLLKFIELFYAIIFYYR